MNNLGEKQKPHFTLQDMITLKMAVIINRGLLNVCFLL